MGWFEDFKAKHPDGHVILVQYWRDGEVIFRDLISTNGGRLSRSIGEPIDRVTVEDYQPDSGFEFKHYGAKYSLENSGAQPARD